MNKAEVIPTVLNVFQPNTFVPTEGYPTGVPISSLANEGVIWARSVMSAHELINTDKRNGDKATRGVIDSLALLSAGIDSIVSLEEINMYRKVYEKINVLVKKEGFSVEPEYARAIYMEAVPELLGTNSISDRFLNSSEKNSIDQVVSFAMQMMRAYRLRETGGVFRIMTQMCAHYDAGELHGATSFVKNLLPQLNMNKIKQVFSPVDKIAHILRRFGIPIEIVQLQVGSDPKNMLAMVPSAVWSYVSRGKVGEMFQVLSRHSHELPQLVTDGLSHFKEDDDYKLIAPTLADGLSEGEVSIMDRTLELCRLYETAYNAYLQLVSQARTGQKESKTVSWISLTHNDVIQFIKYFDSFDEDIMILLRELPDWDGHKEKIFLLMQKTLSFEGWGTLDDTVTFHGRESQRRAGIVATEWRNSRDYNAEIIRIMEDPLFSPNLDLNERFEKARELLGWLDNISNMELGGRAIFNTALYAAFGKNLTEYNANGNLAVMWATEENTDTFAIFVMDSVHTIMTSADRAPIVYSSKERRQPFR
jgi:hypothetical protein